MHPASRSATTIHKKLYKDKLQLICETDDEAVASAAVREENSRAQAVLGHRIMHAKSLLLVFPHDMKFKVDSFLVNLFERHGWTCQTNSGVEIFFVDKRYHDVDCVLFVQSSAAESSATLPCDVETVHRLRLSGFKMIIACLLNSAPSQRVEQKYKMLDLLLDKPVIDPKMDALATACTLRRTELFLDMQQKQQP